MQQPVHAGVRQLRARAARSTGPHDFCVRLAIALAEHALALQVSMGLKRRGESCGHRHVAQPAAIGGRDVTLPVRPLHAQSPFPQIHVAPFQRHHLAAPQSRVAAQQHDEMGARCRFEGRSWEGGQLLSSVADDTALGGRIRDSGRQAGDRRAVYLTVRTYTDAPPIPGRVEDTSNRTLFTSDDILRGQEVFLEYGLVEPAHSQAMGRTSAATTAPRRSTASWPAPLPRSPMRLASWSCGPLRKVG